MHPHLPTVMSSNLRSSISIVKIYSGRGIVIVGPTEQHIAVPKAPLTALRHLGCPKGQFPACHAQELHLGYVTRNCCPRCSRSPSSVDPLNARDCRRIKFFMVSVATTMELSPLVYDGRKFSPKTSTSTSTAKRMFSLPVNDDSGIGGTPESGVAYIR